MKKTYRVLSLSFLFLVMPSLAYAGWMKTYGDRDWFETGTCVKSTSDGKYIVAGSKGAYLWLVKIDSTGDTIWDYIYERQSKLSLSTSGQCVNELPSGDFLATGTAVTGDIAIYGDDFGSMEEMISNILSGQTAVYYEQAEISLWLLKVTTSGSQVWERTRKGTRGSVGNFLCITSDGNCVAVGSAINSTSHKESNTLFVVKSTLRGDEVWSKTYETDSLSSGLFVNETADKGLIICGVKKQDAWLVKMDSVGNKLWSRSYGGNKADSTFALCEMGDGGFLLVGNTLSFGAGKSDLWLVRTGSKGDTLWTKTYGGERNDAGSSIVATADGGAVIAGYTQSEGEGKKDAWLIKVDANGNKTWSKTFGTWQDEEATSVDKTTDGGYVVTGYFTQKGSKDLWIAKVDSNGNVN